MLIPADNVSTLTGSSDGADDTGATLVESLPSPLKQDEVAKPTDITGLVVDVDGDDSYSVPPAPPSLEDRIRNFGTTARAYLGGLTPFSGEKPTVASEDLINTDADNDRPSTFETPRSDLLNVFDKAATDDKTPKHTNSSKIKGRNVQAQLIPTSRSLLVIPSRPASPRRASQTLEDVVID